MGIDVERAARAALELLASFGLDTPELQDTPSRVAAFWAERLSGYDIDPGMDLRPMPSAGLLPPCPVILELVPFASTCEHHLAPFFGHVTLGYLPGAGGIVGLSKLVRLVGAFANRLQVQERMTWQIFSAIETHMRPDAWGVRVVAEHTCMGHRGAKTPGVPVTTQLLGGAWEQGAPGAFN
jgi:GTP cyclohydrolase I